MARYRDELVAAIDAQLSALEGLWSDDLPALNAMAQKAGVPAIVPAKNEPAKSGGGSGR